MGIGLVWLSVVGISVQFFLSMEIERYTLVTGETAVTGFSRLWVGWSVLFVLGTILPNTIPGWASSGAELFTFIFGLSSGAVPIVAMIFLISIALSVTLSGNLPTTAEGPGCAGHYHSGLHGTSNIHSH